MAIHRIKKFGYLLFLIIAISLTIYQVEHIAPYNLNIQQLGQPLAIRLTSGDVKSRFLIRLSNKTNATEHYQVNVSGLPRSAKVLNTEFEVPAGLTYTHYVDLILKETEAEKLSNLVMTISSSQNPHQAEKVSLNYIYRL